MAVTRTHFAFRQMLRYENEVPKTEGASVHPEIFPSSTYALWRY